MGISALACGNDQLPAIHAEAIEFAMRRPPDAIKIVVTVN